MKKFYSVALLLLIAFAGTAQTTTKTTNGSEKPSNCYTRWEEKFEQRGAEDVKDGTHEDIIISVRSGPEAHCYTGKVDVKDGKIVAMYRRLEDGSYELYKPKYAFEKPMTIVNGMSVSMLTVDDELINVIFPKTLKPKKVAYSSAPEPPQD
ncbi:MAG: hypothetical protein Fur0041_09440 [Bacteroidia bacterium]